MTGLVVAVASDPTQSLAERRGCVLPAELGPAALRLTRASEQHVHLPALVVLCYTRTGLEAVMKAEMLLRIRNCHSVAHQ